MLQVLRIVRWLDVCCVCVVLASAAYVYGVKYEVDAQIRIANTIEHKIAKEKDSISFLRAQWSHLNNPTTLQMAAEKYLNLNHMSPYQLAKIQELPVRSGPNIATIDQVPLPPSLLLLNRAQLSNLE